MSDEWVGTTYHVGFWITWVIVFLIVWFICATEGMIGFCLGWMPAAFIASFVAFLWPLVLFSGIVLWVKLSS